MTRDDLVELLRQYHDAAVDEGIAIAKGSPSALADANAGRISARAAVLAAFDEATKAVPNEVLAALNVALHWANNSIPPAADRHNRELELLGCRTVLDKYADVEVPS